MLIVGVTNLKGGVGKTTLAVSLARYASKQGWSVLLLDMDGSQADAMFLLGVEDPDSGCVVDTPAGVQACWVRAVSEMPSFRGYDLVVMDGRPSDRAAIEILSAADVVVVPHTGGRLELRAVRAIQSVAFDATILVVRNMVRASRKKAGSMVPLVRLNRWGCLPAACSRGLLAAVESAAGVVTK